MSVGGGKRRDWQVSGVSGCSRRAGSRLGCEEFSCRRRAMERVLCAVHGVPCLLKTGVKDGPSKGKSFYVCGVQSQPPCGFVLPTQLRPSHCLIHEEYVVDLQVLIQQQDTDQYRLFYRCAKTKVEGKKWCGSIPWKDSQPTRLSTDPQSKHTLDIPINHGYQRNPFKVPVKNQDPLSLEQINDCQDRNSKGKEKRETFESAKKNQQDLSSEYVRKELPKEIKNKCGDKSGGSSKGKKETQTRASDPTAELQETVHLNTQKGCSGKIEIPSGHIKQSSALRPAGDGFQEQKQPELLFPVCSSQTSSIKPFKKEHLGKGRSETCIDKRITEKTHSSGGVEKMTVRPRGSVTIQECASLPTVSPRENLEEQSTLLYGEMTPEGKQDTNENVNSDENESFQPSKSSVGLIVDSLQGKDHDRNLPSISNEKASSQRAEILDSKALHSQLSAQLRQKKSTLKMVNVQALPDKGERLLKQVQELEAALSSLNLKTEEATNEDLPFATPETSTCLAPLEREPGTMWRNPGG